MAYDFTVRDGLAYIEDLTFKTLRLAAGATASITNAMISASAAIASSKLVNRVQATYSQLDGAAVASTTGEGYAIYTADKTSGATIRKVSALCQDVGSGGDPVHNIEIDIKKWDESGSALATVLSATIDITESESDYETVNGTLSDTAMDTGDVLVVQVTVTGAGGTAMQGLLVQVEVDEAGS